MLLQKINKFVYFFQKFYISRKLQSSKLVGIIRIAHLSKNISKLKDLIIEVLSTNYPLTARKIHQQIIRNHSISVSYQRIHKILRELVEYGVLKELEREYLINIEWLDQMIELGERIKRVYLNRPNIMGEETMRLTVSDNSYSLIEKYKKTLATQIESETKNLPFLNALPLVLNNLNVREQAGKKINSIRALLNTHFGLLLGDSGSGKTTTLKMVALQTAKKDKQIPIIMQASNYEGEDLPKIISQIIYNTIRENVSTQLINALLAEGSFKILVDGLNEAVGKIRVKSTLYNRRELLIRRVNSYIQNKQYAKNSFILSGRTYDDPKSKLAIKTFQLQPLTNKMIEIFLSQNDAVELFYQLQKNRKLYSLCRNPFVLSMLLRCHLKGKIKLSRKTDIYNYFIDDFFYSWESKHINSKKEAVVSDMLTLISELAYKMNNLGINIEYLQAHQIMEEKAKQLKLNRTYFNEVLSHILHSNIIQKISNECHFIHQSLQEYFAALALKKKKISDKELEEKILDKQWHDTILFYAGLTENPEKLIELVYKQFIIAKDHNYLFLAAKCAAEVNMMSSDTFDKIIYSLLNVYTYSEDEFYCYWFELHSIFQTWRNRAVTKRLIMFFDESNEEISPRMVNLLHHSDDALHNAKGKEKLKQIINKKSNNKHLLYSAIEIMALTKDYSVAHKLTTFLNDNDFILRAQAAWALIEFGENILANLSFFKQKKINEPIKYLWSIRRKSFDKLIQLLNPSNEDYIRGHAIIELTKINYKKAQSYILKCLKDKKTIIRYHASYMIPNLDDTDGNLLLKHINGENNESFKKILSTVQRDRGGK